MGFQRITYSGATPGADANTYNLFDSTLALGGGAGAQAFARDGAHIFVLDLKNAALGTLKASKSGARDTRGAVTWSQIDQIDVVAAPTVGSNRYEWLVEPYSDWKLDWTNGGSSQATAWLVDMALTDQRPSAALAEPSTFQSLGAATTANVKAVAGRIVTLTATNRNAAVRYLQLFNSTASTATVFYQWLVPAGGMVVLGTDFFTDYGWRLGTGITWGMSTTAGSYVAATAAETDVAGSYR